MVHVSVERDSLVLIVLFNLALMIVCLVENVLTIPVSVLLAGPTLIVPSSCVQMIAMVMVTVRMEHVCAVPISMDLIVQSQFALPIVPTTVCV